MKGAFKGFIYIDPNPNRSWEHTPSMLGIVLTAGKDSRRRGLEITEDIRDVEKIGGAMQCRVVGSDIYVVHIDLDDGIMHCDCPSFEHRDGPCKHVTAFALHLVTEHEGGGPRFWARSVVLESRNAGDQYKLWENRPSLDEKIAEDYGLEIIEMYRCVTPVRGYKLHSGKLWTGALPLPRAGERILAYLPNGEQVPATILDEFNEDQVFLAYRVRMDWVPEGYEYEDTILFGAEMLQASNIHRPVD